jgi:hypothetical protein
VSRKSYTRELEGATSTRAWGEGTKRAERCGGYCLSFGADCRALRATRPWGLMREALVSEQTLAQLTKTQHHTHTHTLTTSSSSHTHTHTHTHTPVGLNKLLQILEQASVHIRVDLREISSNSRQQLSIHCGMPIGGSLRRSLKRIINILRRRQQPSGGPS